MQPKIRSQALIKFAARILKSWTTDDEMTYPGIRFEAGEPEWRGGYGVPHDNDKPDFVKKDNDGWDYAARLDDQ